MAIDFGGAFQYVISGSSESGSQMSASLYPWDEILEVPNYKNYTIRYIHATYHHSESYEEDTGINVALSSSTGKYFLAKEQAISPSMSLSIIAQPLNLSSGWKLIAQSRAEHTADLSVSYMVSSGSDIVRENLAVNYDFMDPDCYTNNATSATNLGTSTVTATLPAAWSNSSGHLLCTDADATFSGDSGQIETDNSSWEFWLKPTVDGTNGLWQSTGWGDPGPGIQLHWIDTPAGTPMDIYVRGGSYDAFEAQESLPEDEWTHVVITYEGTTAKLYTNGTLFQSGTVTAISDGTGGTMGNPHGMGDTYMDIWRVYHKVLTAGEVLQNYDAEKHRFGIT